MVKAVRYLWFSSLIYTPMRRHAQVAACLLLALIPLLTNAQSVVSMPATYQGRRLSVGSGGGFSGAVTTYFLLDNGRLFQQIDPDTTAKFVRQLTRKTTTRLFSTLETRCRIRTTRFSHPGNTYQFIGWQRGASKNTVTWGADGHTPPAGYDAFYQRFLTFIPTSTPPTTAQP